MTREIRFVVPGKPVPKGRPRVNLKTGAVYTPKETRDYERRVAAAFLSAGAGKPQWPGRVGLSVKVYPDKLDVTVQLLDGNAPKRRGDLDNICKAVADALQAVGAFLNDSQIVMMGAVREEDKE